MSPLVQSLISGINCTVFAYGQTSSGKTYTLGSNTLSPLSSTDAQGIISRAIEEVFCVLKEQKKEETSGGGGGGGEEGGGEEGGGEGGGGGRRNEVRVSYIEVYKEEVRDLLAEESLESEIIHIREDEVGHTGIPHVKSYHHHFAQPLLPPSPQWW